MTDPVNKPSHYASGAIECIDAMESAFGREALIEHCRMAAFKYLWRGGKKENTVQDLRKAVWYIEKEISLRGEP